MSAITPILNSLTDFVFNASARTPRHEAMQPTADTRGNLDLGRFLAHTSN